MEKYQNFGDVRQRTFCAYCGGITKTRDHVPSKVFLDEPYPTDLPVVPACAKCNQGFAPDEEYVAALIECVLAGSADGNGVGRHKVRRILVSQPALAARLAKSRQETASGRLFNIETERVKNVVLKLARGHAAFELNEPQLDEPSNLVFLPFLSMPTDVRGDFEMSPGSSIWPEVGSRAMQRMIVGEPGTSIWVNVQPGRYRYLASIGKGVIVRMVIGEYLAGEVVWDYR